MSGVRTAIPSHHRVLAGLVLGALAGVALGLVLAPPVVVAGIVDAGAAVRYGLPVTRVLLDITATIVVGLSILPKLLGFDRPTHTEPIMKLARPAAVIAAAWVITALLAIVLQAAELRPCSNVSITNAIDYIANVGAGKGLLFSAACASVYATISLIVVALTGLVTTGYGLLLISKALCGGCCRRSPSTRSPRSCSGPCWR